MFKVHPEGGAAIQVTRQGGIGPEASPDGQRVYYCAEQSGEGELWSVAAAGGDERRVSGMPKLRADYDLSWRVVATGIYFLDPEKTPRPGVDFFEFATGRVHRVVDIPGRPLRGPVGTAVSPDGRSLLFTQIDDVKSDLMLVENFR